MVNGKKELLKLCFVLRRGMLCIFWVEYNKRLVEIKLNRYLGFSFAKILKKGKVFYISVISKGLQPQFLTDFFFWRTP